MSNNIEFVEYDENVKDVMNYNKISDTTIILTDYISDTEIYDNKFSSRVPTNSYIGTNINYYFGYSKIIMNNITRDNVYNLLCNVLNKYEDKIIWSDIIIKFYNIYFNNYTNKQILILNNLLEEVKVLYFKILEDIKLLDSKKYDLDIVDKSIYEYINVNLTSVIKKLFTKINIFYILSICFNNNESYLLLYDKNSLDILKSYIYV
tara:strand:- start:1367 stop:1984 length:618 start_codon:yes stop_codon:yes gene_type:complete